MGTANLMGRHLGIRWQPIDTPRSVARSIERAQIVHMDAGLANGELFLLMAGVGIDAMIVHELDRMRTGPIHYGSYVLPAAMAISGYRYSPLSVWIDGVAVFTSAPAMAFVGNVSEYGTGFPLLPDARPDDGLLDVCVIPVASRANAVEKFLYAALGEHVEQEGVVYARGSHIQILSPVSVPMQVDGDPAGHTPAEITVLKAQVPFIVPA